MKKIICLITILFISFTCTFSSYFSASASNNDFNYSIAKSLMVSRMSEFGYSLDDYHYVVYTDDSSSTPFFGFSFFDLTKENLKSSGKTDKGEYFVFSSAFCSISYHSDEENPYSFAGNFSNFDSVHRFDIPPCRIVDSNFPIYDSENNDITPVDPLEPPAPFEVTYTPEPFLGMSPNTITYPSKQGASGSNVTSESYTITLDVKLTDYFKNLKSDLGTLQSEYFTEATYSFICYISTEKPTEDDILTSMTGSNCVYTHLHKNNYMYDKTEELDSENPDLVASYDEVTANGVTSVFTIDRDVGSKSIVIDFTNVDMHRLESEYYSGSATIESPLYICVYGVFTSPYHTGAQGDDEKISNLGCPKDFYTKNISGMYETDERYGTEYYSRYSVVSEPFNYVNYPEYTELLIEGHKYDTFGDVQQSLVYKPSTLQNLEQKQNNVPPMSYHDYEIYESDKQWSENFNSDFGVGSVTDLFNGTSTFYQFLTASVSVLPSWFLTILASFFICVLTIFILKLIFK